MNEYRDAGKEGNQNFNMGKLPWGMSSSFFFVPLFFLFSYLFTLSILFKLLTIRMNSFYNQRKNDVFILKSSNDHVGGKEMEPVSINTFQKVHKTGSWACNFPFCFPRTHIL